MNYDTEKEAERVILLAVDLSQKKDTTEVDISLDELEELAETAGAVTVGRLVQKRERIHPGTYIGKGKMEELRLLVEEKKADSIVCDDELSPAQITNLQEELQVKVIDRTVMILDIFAAHARTSEGKLQVELAQLRYRSSRLTGLGKSLSRLGGGIGTRGPGEKKLEMDRRFIKERIAVLNRQLKDVVQNRDVMRRQRSKNAIPTVAIVGYTNAGKSTLLNALTGAAVLSEDKFFATLDPTTRGLEFEDGQKILLTDTVGFISKLPHPLIRAFRSTLEEAKYADLILHVVDVSNPHHERQMEVVYDTLRELEVGGKPVITVFNKIDQLAETDPFAPGEKGIRKDRNSESSVLISARERVGLDELLIEIERIVNEGMERIEQLIPYEEAGKIQQIRQYGKLESEEYQENGIFVKAWVPHGGKNGRLF